jgi:magnesium transporter
MTQPPVTPFAELQANWPHLSLEDRVKGFRKFTRDYREDLFLSLSSADQAELVLTMPEHERRTYLRTLPPDDVADLIQEAGDDEKDGLMSLLDDVARTEVRALLAYAEDDAGGLMSPRFARLRPDMTVDEAITYLRLQSRNMETVYYAYVLDAQQRLLGVVSFREMFTAHGAKTIENVMHRDIISVQEETDQEEVARLFSQHDLAAIPVVNASGVMRGIVTIDDIVDVVQEEATEDIQKIGGMEALDAPYLDTGFFEMVRKRAGWLAVLFFGEMLTTHAMAHYEDEIARAVVLAVFIPLIISSGGNSGSQASTLVIRAMALGEVRLKDWWKVVRREMLSGLVLGGVLGLFGLARVVVWEWFGGTYGPHYFPIGLTVGLSLLGVIMFGTVAGSMLPFILRRFGFDPASASAPFVATLVDVTGLVIYFSLASYLLRGTLL